MKERPGVEVMLGGGELVVGDLGPERVAYYSGGGGYRVG